MHGEPLNRPTWGFIRVMENEPFAVVSRESAAWTPVLVRCSHVSRMKRLRYLLVIPVVKRNNLPMTLPLFKYS